MPSGRFGKADLAANTHTDLYTVPAGKVATASVCLVNRGAADVTVRVAVRTGAAGAAPDNADYLEYDTKIPPGGVLERTQIALSAGETVTVRSSASGVSARIHGFEESA